MQAHHAAQLAPGPGAFGISVRKEISCGSVEMDAGHGDWKAHHRTCAVRQGEAAWMPSRFYIVGLGSENGHFDVKT